MVLFECARVRKQRGTDTMSFKSTCKLTVQPLVLIRRKGFLPNGRQDSVGNSKYGFMCSKKSVFFVPFPMFSDSKQQTWIIIL